MQNYFRKNDDFKIIFVISHTETEKTYKTTNNYGFNR